MTNLEAVKILENGILNGKDDTPENNEAIALAISALKSIDRITAERDAAIADVKKLSHAVHDPCCYCKNLVHWDYELNNEPCCMCEIGDKWEWRGVKDDD